MTASPSCCVLHLSLPVRTTLAPGRSHTVAAAPICSLITTLLPDAPRASAAASSSGVVAVTEARARKKKTSRDARKEEAPAGAAAAVTELAGARARGGVVYGATGGRAR